MADNQGSSQKDVSQYCGDEAVKMWSFDLEEEGVKCISSSVQEHRRHVQTLWSTYVVFKAQSNHGEVANVVRTKR